MTTTTLRAALAHVRALPWGNYRIRAIAGLQLCWAVAQLLVLAIALAGQTIYAHRAQIRAALVAAVAAVVVAGQWTRLQAERTYRAGAWCRLQLEALSTRSAALLPQQPLAPLAPITASLQAAREALEQLVRRLYPVLA